jgi:hypothetical protein
MGTMSSEEPRRNTAERGFLYALSVGLDPHLATTLQTGSGRNRYYRTTPYGSGGEKRKMIGAKKAGPKASSAIDVWENLKQDMAKELTLRSGGDGEPNWNAIKASKDLAARQAFDVEKYRTLLRRY